MSKSPNALFSSTNVPDPLNNKNRSVVEYYWQRIKDDQMDWELVSGLLTALRPGMGKAGTSGLRDIADFVAHPTRDRGLIFEHVDKGQPEIVSGVLRIPVLPLSKVIHTLGQLIVHHRIAPQQEMQSVLQPREAEFCVCALSLLHFGEIQLTGERALLKIGSNFGRLWLNVEFANGDRYPRLSTGLIATGWSECSPREFVASPKIRAVRGSDGLKLRKM